MNAASVQCSGAKGASSRISSSDTNPTFYIWIDGKLRHCLPAPDIDAAITWADEQYPYARQREIYRSFRLGRQQ
jgi:hypothetical protein